MSGSIPDGSEVLERGGACEFCHHMEQHRRRAIDPEGTGYACPVKGCLCRFDFVDYDLSMYKESRPRKPTRLPLAA